MAQVSASPLPYAAPAGWYAARLARACGRGGAVFPVASRALARCSIAAGRSGAEVLSVPVEGGARTLRRMPAEPVRLSEHGGWRRVHWGALTAAYGRAPYFEHLAPALEEIYGRPWEYLHEFCAAIDAVVCDAMRWQTSAAEIAALCPPGHPVPLRWTETAAAIRPELSIYDAVFHLGPEAILGLAASLDAQTAPLTGADL